MKAAARPSPASDLWNRVAVLTRDERVCLDQLTWQTRKAVMQSPGDLCARLAAAYAHLKRGDKDEGLQHLRCAKELRGLADPVDLHNLATVMLDTGDVHGAWEIVERLLRRPEARGDTTLACFGEGLALRAGDIEKLEQVLSATGVIRPDAEIFINTVKSSKLVQAFQLHQELVESVLRTSCCTFSAEIVVDDEGEIGAHLSYFTNIADVDRRMDLYDDLSDPSLPGDVVMISAIVSIGIWGPEVPTTDGPA